MCSECCCLRDCKAWPTAPNKAGPGKVQSSWSVFELSIYKMQMDFYWYIFNPSFLKHYYCYKIVVKSYDSYYILSLTTDITKVRVDSSARPPLHTPALTASLNTSLTAADQQDATTLRFHHDLTISVWNKAPYFSSPKMALFITR